MKMEPALLMQDFITKNPAKSIIIFKLFDVIINYFTFVSIEALFK